MPLHIALAFNLTQHLSEQALTASRVSYRGLLGVLRAHPRLKFNLQISGTLVHALNWLDPEPLEMIREGLAAGQFELLASTYAHNASYATDDWDNAKQITLHRETLRTAFGVEPAGFWNPGRAWRQSLVPVIADSGGRVTLVEDHILHASGAQNPYVYTTQHAGRSLNVIYDDTILRAKINFAAWFGRGQRAFDYLWRIAERPASGRFCLAYAEEAEAMGLWGWQLGLVPQQTWAQLDAFLSELETKRWLKTIHISQAPQPTAELTPLAEGASGEMDRRLWAASIPESGTAYSGWLDYVARSANLSRYRSLYDSIRARLRRIAGENTPRADASDSDYSPPTATRSPLVQQAVHALSVHQFKFGFPGYGGPTYRGWQGARTAFVLARAAELAAKPRTGLWIEDINGDGSDEILLCDGRQMAVVSPYGARLFFWIDLAQGRQWIGNPLAVTDAPHQGDSAPPILKSRPREWWPAPGEVNLSEFRAFKVKEDPPTRLGAYLPEWVWEGAARPVTLYARPMQLEGEIVPLPAGNRALNDTVILNGGPPLVPGPGDYRVEGDAAVLTRFLAPDFVMVKRFRLSEGGVLAQYRLENRADTPCQVELRVASELCPDYMEVLNGGRESLEYVLFDDIKPGVRNTRTGRAVSLAPSRPWTRVERSEALLALELALVFEFELAPQTAQTFDLKLSVMRIQPLQP